MKAGLLASGNLFDSLEIRPVVGRAFRPEEDQAPARDAVAVLAYSFWRMNLLPIPISPANTCC